MRHFTDKQYIETARALYQKDGEVEIDDNLGTEMVSRGEDPGAYVQAWVWVYASDVRERQKGAAKQT
jgi:hypothetical protein